MSINTFVARLLDTAGQYRVTTRNEAAIGIIRRGAGLGDEAWERLPMVLANLAKQAAQLLNSRGDDTGYRTIIIISDTLLPAAVRQLAYALKDESRKDEMRVRVQGYSLNHATNREELDVVINADAWAEQTTVQIAESEEKHAGNDMGFESRGMLDSEAQPERFTADQIREYIGELAKLLFGYVLPADKLVNGWRADHADTPALAFAIVPHKSGSYLRAESVEQALQMLELVADERELRNRQTNRSLVAAAVGAWG